MARPQLTDEEIDGFREEACLAALEVIQEKGVDGLTVRELGRKMGCSYAKPYRYFGDKNRLVDAVRAHAFDMLAAFISGEHPDATLVEPMERYLRFAAQQPAAFEIMFGFSQPYVSEETRQAENRAWKTCAQPFHDMVASGVMKGNPETLAHITWVALHGLSALTLSKQLTHGMTEDEIIIELRNLLFGGEPNV